MLLVATGIVVVVGVFKELDVALGLFQVKLHES